MTFFPLLSDAAIHCSWPTRSIVECKVDLTELASYKSDKREMRISREAAWITRKLPFLRKDVHCAYLWAPSSCEGHLRSWQEQAHKLVSKALSVKIQALMPIILLDCVSALQHPLRAKPRLTYKDRSANGRLSPRNLSDESAYRDGSRLWL